MLSRITALITLTIVAVTATPESAGKETFMKVSGVFASTEMMEDLSLMEREIIRELEKLYLRSLQATDNIKQHLDEWRNSQAPLDEEAYVTRVMGEEQMIGGEQSSSLNATETHSEHESSSRNATETQHEHASSSPNATETHHEQTSSLNTTEGVPEHRVSSPNATEAREPKSSLDTIEPRLGSSLQGGGPAPANYSVRINEVLERLAHGNSRRSVYHPIDAFLLIKRRTHSYIVVINTLKKLITSIKTTLIELQTDDYALLPKPDDFHGTAESLVKMQKLYMLDSSDLAQGIIRKGDAGAAKELRSHNKLSLWDTLFLAEAAERIRHKEQRRSWYAEAAAMMERGAQLPEDLAHIIPKLQQAAREEKEATTEAEAPKPKVLPKLNRITGPEESAEYHRRLCAGDNLRSADEVSMLYCSLEDQGSPYLLLMPLKREVVALSPPVVLYRNFLTPTQAKIFIQYGKPQLDLAEVHGKEDPTSTMDRVSMTSFIGKSEFGDPEKEEDLNPEVDHNDFLTHMNKRIEEATKLRVASSKAAESYQAANYGIGGMYNLHFDFGLRIRRHGERLATFLMYLTDVEAGGGTVFPRLGVRVEPELGTALLWYNLKPSGHSNELMHHAGCPVLHGNKWIATKWILYDLQFNRFKCGLSYYDKLHL